MPKRKPGNAQAGSRARDQASANGAIREAVKIEVRAALERFKESETETEFVFPSAFASAERAYIHKLCKTLGLQSKSYGMGEERSLKVSRRVETEVESSRSAQVAPAIVNVLQAPLRDFPSADEAVAASPAHSTADIKPSKTGVLGSLAPQVPSVARRPAELSTFREQLPVWTKQDEILQLIAKHQVILIAGGTGCGKTTQVPQFLLDAATRHNQAVQVVCTQPRRLSAIGVAERVAAERGEQVGGSIGYMIRLENRMSKSTTLTFCTNGILLRALMSDTGGMDTLTHVIVDEIHERDRFSDFLLISLRTILKERPNLRLILMSATMNTELFVQYFNNCPIVGVEGRTYPVQAVFLADVLYHTGHHNPGMAALLSSNQSDGGALQEHDDRLQRAVSALAASTAEIGTTASSPQPLQSETEDEQSERQLALEKEDGEGVEMAAAAASKLTVEDRNHGDEEENDDYDEDDEDVIIIDSDVELESADEDNVGDENDATAGPAVDDIVTAQSEVADVGTVEADATAVAAETTVTVADGFQGDLSATDAHVDAGIGAEELQERERLLMAYQESFNDDRVDVGLIVTLLQKVIVEGADGAILVFLPGYEEIMAVEDHIQAGPHKHRVHIIKLHSMLQPAEQRKVFQGTPRGKRKLVLSTNIAETSLTINDVVFVIDSCKVNEKSYDSSAGVSTLQLRWVSQASAVQRRGRAGRCQSGICYHLISQQRFTRLALHQQPELLRIPLQELCLHTKLLTAPSVSIADFLGQAPDPPPVLVLNRAIRRLQHIGALDDEENLTTLGRHLSVLSVEPRLGKMVLYSVLFCCLEPVVIIACALAYRDPFVLPLRRQKSASEARRHQFSAGSLSDHITVYHAYQEWLKRGPGTPAAYRFCSENFLSHPVLQTIHGMSRQLHGQLVSAGFVNKFNESWKDSNSRKVAVVKAVLCAGLYPSVARRNPVTHRLMTPRENKIYIHASSSLSQSPIFAPLASGGGGSDAKNARKAACADSWVVYEELARVHSKVTVKCCSSVSSLSVMIMAGDGLPSTPPVTAVAAAAIATSAQPSSAPSTTGPASSAASAVSDPTTSVAPHEQALATTAAATVQTTSGAAVPVSGGSAMSVSATMATSTSVAGDHADDLTGAADDGLAVLQVDDWISFRLDPKVVDCLTSVRCRLHAAFQRLLASPHKKRSPQDMALVRAIVNAITMEAAKESGSAEGYTTPQHSVQQRPDGRYSTPGGTRGGATRWREGGGTPSRVGGGTPSRGGGTPSRGGGGTPSRGGASGFQRDALQDLYGPQTSPGQSASSHHRAQYQQQSGPSPRGQGRGSRRGQGAHRGRGGHQPHDSTPDARHHSARPRSSGNFAASSSSSSPASDASSRGRGAHRASASSRHHQQGQGTGNASVGTAAATAHAAPASARSSESSGQRRRERSSATDTASDTAGAAASVSRPRQSSITLAANFGQKPKS
ncbi:3'-5' RNA helicase YTHDC2-like isoform X2 [Sycon ciliatum]|uniref:3'-5' RNA helicase YTHDC2-like isoform X2 n=1 Tax=Sycon ciliatum TaxID=27933 RepID=UPI0031F70E4F